MNLPWPDAIARLQMHAVYPALFEEAFGSPGVTPTRVTQAIAQFERTLISHNSPWDQAYRLEGLLSEDAFSGFNTLYLSEQFGDCFHRHGVGPVFDNSAYASNGQVFLNNGLDSEPDPGLFAVTGDESDRGKFKVPTLRNIAVTGPYMHNGRF